MKGVSKKLDREEGFRNTKRTLIQIDNKFFLNFYTLNTATTSDIDKIGVKLDPVLKELGFSKPCTECWEVFKTGRQVRNHTKVKPVNEEE